MSTSPNQNHFPNYYWAFSRYHQNFLSDRSCSAREYQSIVQSIDRWFAWWQLCSLPAIVLQPKQQLDRHCQDHPAPQAIWLNRERNTTGNAVPQDLFTRNQGKQSQTSPIRPQHLPRVGSAQRRRKIDWPSSQQIEADGQAIPDLTTERTSQIRTRRLLPFFLRRECSQQVVAQYGRTPILLDVFNDEFRASHVADIWWLAGVIHRVGQISD